MDIANTRFPRHIQRQACAHELGHIVLHHGWGYFFIIHWTYFAPSKFEWQANEFAWDLLFDLESCKEDYGGDVGLYARQEGITELARYIARQKNKLQGIGICTGKMA